MASLRSAIRNRDEAFQDDIVMFGVDTFDNDYLIQPLLQWNPTPFTIFYIGGNNNYQFNDRFDAYRFHSSSPSWPSKTMGSCCAKIMKLAQMKMSENLGSYPNFHSFSFVLVS